mmetsp:Transcript_29889/g.45699  ORF Transcript_29889/g.45699 Transcript_29889/m.45699 type:complete len:180 (+) Transcript_29889:789-1328(+)
MTKNLATLKKQTTHLPENPTKIDVSNSRHAFAKKQTVALSKKPEPKDASASKQDLSFMNAPLVKSGVDGITSRMRTSDDDRVQVRHSLQAQKKQEEAENPYHESFDLQPKKNPRSNYLASSSESDQKFVPHVRKLPPGEEKKEPPPVEIKKVPLPKKPQPQNSSSDYQLPTAQAQMMAM